MKKLALVLMAVAGAASAGTVDLKPQPGVALLPQTCGTLNTSTYVTRFNADGTISGEIQAWMRCGSGRTAHQYQSWHSITWDLAGVALMTLPYDYETPDTGLRLTYAGYTAYDRQYGMGSPWAYQAELATP